MKKYIYICIVILFSLVSCEKSKVGPRGVKGEQGIEGGPGKDGKDGKDGQAENSYYSSWTQGNFIKHTNGYYFATVKSDQITSDVINKGNVLVYFKRDNIVYKADYWTPEESLTARPEIGGLVIYSKWDPTGNTLFRYVVVFPEDVSDINK